MRQQVIHQDAPAGQIPPPSSNGRSSNNTHSRISNGGSRNGNNSGTFDCTDEAALHSNQNCPSSGNAVTSSSTSFYPTKTQIISRDGATLERITQVHISHIQHNNNTESKGSNIFRPNIALFIYLLLDECTC